MNNNKKEIFIIHYDKKIYLGYVTENESGIYPNFKTQYKIDNNTSIFMTSFKIIDNCSHHAVFDLYTSDGAFSRYIYNSNMITPFSKNEIILPVVSL